MPRPFADIVVLAERETEPSRAVGESLLRSTPHQRIELPATPAGTEVEAFRLGGPADKTALFAWYSRGLQQANLRYAEDLDEVFEARGYVMLYRHRSRQELRRMTVHCTGNPGEPPGPDYGLARTLGLASPRLMHDALLHMTAVTQQRSLNCVCSYEITHHNPVALRTPNVFLEIGDGPVQWADPVLVDALAEVARRLCFERLPAPSCTCVGVSYGDHYAGALGRRTLAAGYAFGHIISSTVLPGLSVEDLQRVVLRTEGTVDRLVFKRLKGLPSEERERWEAWCRDQGIVLEKA